MLESRPLQQVFLPRSSIEPMKGRWEAPARVCARTQARIGLVRLVMD
jgi:hypothetical protein